ncbi:30S ribosomal protein S11 [Candidatus Uhrbacteria bacterium]|nr:30S ribosomal protein S11 [Candidatus Uhrbacteria bacterium]
MDDQTILPATEEAALDASLATDVVKSEGAEKKPSKDRRKKKKLVRMVPRGRAYVQATYNNTIITFTDPQGNVLSWSSSGKVGFRGPKKSTSYAAGIVVRDAVSRIEGSGLKEVEVFVKGVGAGREAAVRALNANGLEVLSIKDITPLPHNGPRPPKVRRV